MKKAFKLYTDIDGRGNWIRNIKVDLPTLDTDPANKEYVDVATTFDTEKANAYDTPFVEVGGIKKDFHTNNKHFKELFDEMFFPLIKPTYIEGSIKAEDEPIKCILGTTSKFTCYASIDIGDRKRVASNISCIMQSPDGTKAISYINPGQELKNIKCQFEPKAIDPESITQLMLTAVLSEADTKYDSYGQESPDIIFQSNYTVSHVIKYKGILPLFYGFYGLQEFVDVDVHSENLSWSTIQSNLNVIDNVDMYYEGFGTKEITFRLTNSIPQKVVLIVPNICKEVFINDDNILECCDTVMHELVMPNAREGYLQKYTAILFQTGTAAYLKPKTVRVVWEDTNELQTSGVTVSQKQDAKTGHIIIDDNYIEYSQQRRLHITNARVENKLDEEVTTVHVHPVNAPVDGGYYDA